MPLARGPVSAALRGVLLGADPRVLDAVDVVPARSGHDMVGDDDRQLALWMCFELHYRGFDDAATDLEWDPSVLGLRRRLEDQLLDHVRCAVTLPDTDVAAHEVATRLFDLVADDTGPSLARFVQREATAGQVREIMAHRSLYQLKEADPHSWAIPRLDGRAKAALVEIQTDEYGNGVPERMHAELFRTTLRGVGLDERYAGYVDAVPGVTLALTNIISVFAFRRSLVGALVGHLAAYEMTSSDPSRRVAVGLRRLGFDDATCRFFDEHVTADALHEQLAAHDLCASLAATHPSLGRSVLFGAAAALYVDRCFAEHVLGAFATGGSSLRRPLVDPAPVTTSRRSA